MIERIAEADANGRRLRPRQIVAGILLLLIIAAGVYLLAPRPDAPAPVSDVHAHGTDAHDRAGTDDGGDDDLDAAVAAGERLDPTVAEPSTIGTSAETSLAAAANAPTTGERDNDALPGAREAISVEEALGERSTGLGGCLAEYGDAGQCLPVIPPSEAAHVADMEKAGLDASTMTHYWSCDELRTYFADGIRVRKVADGQRSDPQRLDRDGDGIACGPTD